MIRKIDVTPPRLLSGTFHATAAVVRVDPGIIGGWLPPGIRFPEKHPAPHPLMIIWGAQRDVSAFPGGSRFPFPWRLNYSEIITAVPDLRLDASSAVSYDGPVTYLPRLYMNSWRAALLGRAFYGFSKAFARIEDCPGSYRAVDRRGRHMLTATIRHRSVRRAVDRRAVRLFDQPVALRTADRLELARFENDIAEETIHPVSLRISIQPALLSYLPEINRSIGSIEQEPDGAFQFSSSWSLWRVV